VQAIATVTEDPGDVLDIATRTGGRHIGTERAEDISA
jgi:hypothetical protein